ncbi:coiled-coil domain-containing protein 42 homolog [Fopius arisanus]|uniref:Coiled-coil domain-containing protein 42 homolog n=2 Tax=Fopius arisanus TaxID=64838 RepID=A0A9R1U5X7_9HYME|nr:PREDICTED: coiled-coil domain-containing protein 42 homolog [Fopius arisanus]
MAAKINKGPRSLVQRAVITRDPDKAISEYFQSKLEARQVTKYPEWDVARHGPEAELMKARRDLSQAEQELEIKRVEHENKRHDMDQQWAEMRRKQNLFRESFVKFDQFVQENKEKRERAERKIKEEKERQENCGEEIKILKDKIEHMTAVRDKMQKYVKDYKNAQSYLEKVISETGEFQSISDIFNRFESLVEARKTLTMNQDENLNALGNTSTEMQKLTEEKGQKLMSLNSQLASLESRYDRAKAASLKWEGIVAKIKSTAGDKNLELTQIRSCCWNIYQQICKRKGISVEVDKGDIENQLVHIKSTILELKRIVKAAKKKVAKDAKGKKK